jgi:hypothetical protein
VQHSGSLRMAGGAIDEGASHARGVLAQRPDIVAAFGTCVCVWGGGITRLSGVRWDTAPTSFTQSMLPTLFTALPEHNNLVTSLTLMPLYEELAGHELVGVHAVQQLAPSRVLRLQVLTSATTACGSK